MSVAASAQGISFRDLFINDTPFIDTRAPIEFAKGAFPSSTSIPLMTDDERAQVGTCYKQKGQQAAIALGHQLVQGDIKTARVADWVSFAKSHPEGYLYCWRGGLRSEICQQWIAEAGLHYPRIPGGYKAMRRFLIDQQTDICQRRPLLLLGGRTGCDKTALIREHPFAVDLEGLANHLGSSFGRRPGGQPSQLSFENALAIALLKVDDKDDSGKVPIVLEDESHLIGRCSLPLPLREKMARSELVLLEIPLRERVELSYRNYILRKLDEWQQTVGDEAGFAAFEQDLVLSLQRVRKRLGGLRYSEMNAKLQAALAAHRRGDAEAHRAWIEPLLVNYYDPMYDYQLQSRQPSVAFRGNRREVEAFLQSRQSEQI